MKNEFDLKALWSRQPATTPDFEAVLQKARSVRQQLRKKAILLILLLAATLAAVICIWCLSTLHFASTKAGVSLLIVAIVIMVVNQLRFVQAIGADQSQASTDYLRALLIIRKKQEYTSRTIMSVYFLLLTAGAALYLFEPLSHKPAAWLFGGYALTFGFFAYMWFVVRPKKIKEQQSELNSIISRIEECQAQLRDVSIS
ncbi:hypothetical protein [Chitinophaga vietnamensis]|uniref:hypothetical protein n=1 Tax=Chitinophaga vietnamensis TaxID=2593957 RepID=UPI0011788EA8|nr:hypothetical protein [Chitinophaga vietnamensis]